MKHYQYLILFYCFSLLPVRCIKAQKTPEEMGRFIFYSIQKDSLSKIDALIPTINEMKKVAALFGLTKDSKKYRDMIDGYQAGVDEFHESLNLLYSDTIDTGLKWKFAKLEKVTKLVDSIKVDDKNPNSKKLPAIILKIYLTCNSGRFVIVLDDVFPVGDLWKTGDRIYMRKIK